jgi:hypothetical protein
MSEEKPLGSVTFGHRVNRGDTSVMVKLEFEQTGRPADDLALAREYVFVAKGLAFEELGIEYDQADDGTITPKGGWATLKRDDAPKAGTPTADDVKSLSRPSHIPDWLWADLQANPSNYFDNRADKASGKVPPTRPDFKSKDGKRTIYLTPKMES